MLGQCGPGQFNFVMWKCEPNVVAMLGETNVWTLYSTYLFQLIWQCETNVRPMWDHGGSGDFHKFVKMWAQCGSTVRWDQCVDNVFILIGMIMWAQCGSICKVSPMWDYGIVRPMWDHGIVRSLWEHDGDVSWWSADWSGFYRMWDQSEHKVATMCWSQLVTRKSAGAYCENNLKTDPQTSI